MNSIPLDLAIPGWLVLAALVLAAARELRASPDPFLPAGANQHLWLGAIVMLAFVWSLRVRALPGLEVGLWFGPLVTLLFGRTRAFLALLSALVVDTGLGPEPWLSFGFNALLLAALPVALTAGGQALLARWLPRNVFVFMIGNGLFVVFAATALTAVGNIAMAVALAWMHWPCG